MPTVLLAQGWRLYFYSNEGSEPMHVHARKGEAESKFWLFPERFDIEEEFQFGCTPRLTREIRRIIYQHFDEICDAWRTYFRGA